MFCGRLVLWLSLGIFTALFVLHDSGLLTSLIVFCTSRSCFARPALVFSVVPRPSSSLMVSYTTLPLPIDYPPMVGKVKPDGRSYRFYSLKTRMGADNSATPYSPTGKHLPPATLCSIPYIMGLPLCGFPGTYLLPLTWTLRAIEHPLTDKAIYAKGPLFLLRLICQPIKQKGRRKKGYRNNEIPDVKWIKRCGDLREYLPGVAMDRKAMRDA